MTTAHHRARAAYGRGAETLPPARQIVILYDAAIACLGEARQAAEQHRIEDRWRAAGRARAIVEALKGCLDFERGGEIAPLLDRLYGYLLHRMLAIDLHNEAAACDEVAARLAELRDAWAGVAGSVATPAVAPMAATAPLTA